MLPEGNIGFAPAYGDGFEFRNGAHLPVEYSYDANGNLTQDLNRGILEIQYNYLNLSIKVVFSDGSTLSHAYRADGTKFRTVHIADGDTTTTDYHGNAVYENGTPKLLIMEEGYFTLPDGKFHDFHKDHLGNVRAVTDEEGRLEEVNDYYPFGGLMATSTPGIQPRKYNGKELESHNGLNWYDYGARRYDPVIGRFTTVDPSSESYYATSPYTYCDNNPINRIDPTGADWIQDRYGSFLWDKNAIGQETTRSGWNYVGTSLPEGASRYSILEEINGGLYHKHTSNPLASLVNRVAGHAVMVEKKAYNPGGDQMMRQLVETGGGFVAGASIGKVLKWLKGGNNVVKESVARPYTKSNLKLGQEMHAAYHRGEYGKEFVLPSKKRIDFLDIPNRTIHELKPYNPRAIKQGEKQLQMYLKELQSPAVIQKHPEFEGIQWKTVLDTY